MIFMVKLTRNEKREKKKQTKRERERASVKFKKIKIIVEAWSQVLKP
jgi:hypothetical protein